VNDSQRFLLEHFDTIRNSPSQIYHYALPFSPSLSWLHKYYTAELSGVVNVVRGLPARWGTCSRTVKLDGYPLALTCWKDTIAVGLWSSDIIILNMITGSQVAVLSGHTGWIMSLAFSSDGVLLVSGSTDWTLNLWDVQTGGVVKTFHGHNDSVCSVSISPDCTMITSGSSDNTIHVWDIQKGKCHCVIQQAQVLHVGFSSTNTQHFISASSHVVQEWDIEGHQVGPTHKGSYTGFSANSTHFISCLEGFAGVHDSVSGAVVAKCPIPNPNPTPDVIHSCFSPNGRLIAVAAENTIYIWDITNLDPLLIETFIGHPTIITSLTFSSPSTLISASEDKSVKFWQIGDLSTDLVTGDPKSTPPTSIPIKSVSLQAADGIAISSDLDGVVKVWDISTGLCKALFQTPAKGHYWRDAQMIDGRMIFVWPGKKGIHIWDINEGKLLQVINAPGVGHCGLKISGDGSKVFIHTGRSIEAWSIQTGETAGVVHLKGDSLSLLRTDGSRIWLSFKDKPIQGWDFGAPGTSPIPLSNMHPERLHLYSVGGPSRIEDVVTRKVVFLLFGRYAMPNFTQWDGQYLVAGYESGEVLILDLSHLGLEQ
jgi:WD40 repeat protein